jgi:alanine racemase
MAPIADARWIPAGDTVAGKLKLRRSVRTGIIPVGYASGVLVEKPVYAKLIGLAPIRRGYGKIKVRLDTGEDVSVLGLIGQNHMVLDLTHSKAAVGTIARVEVNPMFAGTLPRKLQ